jgi:hypothetical protein
MPSLLLASASLLGLAASGQAAPGLPDKPAKWQYAELSYRYIPAQSAGTAADGTVVPGKPPREVVRWVTAEGEVEAKGWADLAEQLKAPAFKKEGSAAYQRVQVLNHLGSEGWELMEQTEATTTTRGAASPRTWTFKRRVP